MEAGRELDALVAEKVMGEKNDGTLEAWVPRYSLDIAEALKVVEHLNDTLNPKLWTGDFWLKFDGGQWEAGWSFSIKNDEGSYEIRIANGYSDTASHAICLAALKAVGVEA